jgi:hypothetical protein
MENVTCFKSCPRSALVPISLTLIQCAKSPSLLSAQRGTRGDAALAAAAPAPDELEAAEEAGVEGCLTSRESRFAGLAGAGLERNRLDAGAASAVTDDPAAPFDSSADRGSSLGIGDREPSALRLRSRAEDKFTIELELDAAGDAGTGFRCLTNSTLKQDMVVVEIRQERASAELVLYLLADLLHVLGISESTVKPQLIRAENDLFYL